MTIAGEICFDGECSAMEFHALRHFSDSNPLAPDLLEMFGGELCLIPSDKTTVIAGPPASGKSMLLGMVALDFVRAKGGEVYLIDTENSPGGVRSRLRALGALDSDFNQIYFASGQRDAIAVDSLLYRAAYVPILVLIDSFDRLIAGRGGDHNNSTSVSEIWDLLRPLQGEGIGVVIADHCSTLGGPKSIRQIGSTAKEAGADVVLLIDGGNGRRKVRLQKDRNWIYQERAISGILAEIEISSDDGELQVTLHAANELTSELRSEVVDWVQSQIVQSDAGRTRNWLRENRKKAAVAISKDDIGQALEVLVAQGAVLVVDGSHRTDYVAVVPDSSTPSTKDGVDVSPSTQIREKNSY